MKGKQRSIEDRTYKRPRTEKEGLRVYTGSPREGEGTVGGASVGSRSRMGGEVWVEVVVTCVPLTD